MWPAILSNWKLIGAVALAALIFGSGFKVGGWRCDAARASELEALQAQIESERQAWVDQQQADQAARVERERRIADQARRIAALRGDIRNAQLAAPECDRLLSGDGVRLFNDILSLPAATPEG